MYQTSIRKKKKNLIVINMKTMKLILIAKNMVLLKNYWAIVVLT
uniref:Uncharacterized protein n=1 Tax=Virus NIOZ-UU159 TaxID=2763270 RepID=A0A7S9STB8_9VIRU|nr:MAG: hypothetical protein NIOZUU159_00303 [Virus NIOZ-UU159]